MLQNGQTYLKNLAVYTARFLKYVWPFLIIMHERVNQHWVAQKQNFCLETFLSIQPLSVTSLLDSYYVSRKYLRAWQMFQLNKNKLYHERFRSKRKKVLYDMLLLSQTICKVKYCKVQFRKMFAFV